LVFRESFIEKIDSLATIFRQSNTAGPIEIPGGFMNLLRVPPLLLACAFVVLVSWNAYAQAPMNGPALDQTAREMVVRRLAELLDHQYALADTGRHVSAALLARLERGEYESHPDGPTFVAQLSRDVVEITGDKHLQVFYSAEPQAWVLDPDESPEDRGRRIEEERRAGRHDNFGFPEVQILAGNVGYLRVSRLPAPEISGRALAAAMAFLSNSDALIIDLRATGGGHYHAVALLQSYLLGPEPVHLTTIRHRRDEREEQLWTLPYVPGPRLLTQPVYVLTSSRTFSAPEYIAYDLQTLGRAKVVGERTAGGALPGRTFRIDPHFAVWISTGVPISPVTGGNWEGTGVGPDLAVPAGRALLRAHSEAVRRIAASASDSSETGRLTWLADRLDAQVEPRRVDRSMLRRYAGQYGPHAITYEEGELYYYHDGEARFRLIPLAADLFQLDGVDTYRIRFELDERDRVRRLVGLPLSGAPDSYPRTR
jgi:retinol-binding protein 3